MSDNRPQGEFMTEIERLRAALREAIQECRAHNGNYHHTSPQAKLAEWEALVNGGRQTSRST
jgi:hypothetical protein